TPQLLSCDTPACVSSTPRPGPAIARMLAGRGTLLAVDNTWGCPGLYHPLALGADISIVAVTKYVAGHSDLMMGSVSAGSRCADQIWTDARLLGRTGSPDDAYSALKGLRAAAAPLALHPAHARRS